MDFLSNFTNLFSKIENEYPYASFFLLGILMCTHNSGGLIVTQWLKGRDIENLLSSLGLSQLISEPTNFEANKNPSCTIDLIITDQPNLALDSGTRASLDSFYHHQITYCKINFNLPPPPHFERTIWHYHRTNISLLKRSMSSFPWLQHLNINQDPNWKVKTFTKIILNIMSNFIPNEIKIIVRKSQSLNMFVECKSHSLNVNLIR